MPTVSPNQPPQSQPNSIRRSSWENYEIPAQIPVPDTFSYSNFDDLEELTNDLTASMNTSWATVSATSSIPILNPYLSPIVKSNHKWPIGTIVKWDLKVAGVKEHLSGTHREKAIFAKVLTYHDNGSIRKVRWIGDVEDDVITYDNRYFTEATPQECKKYEETMVSLRQCTTRPEIGIVLEYLGSDSSLRGKRGVVTAHARGNTIQFHWFNEVRRDENIGFNRFRISDSQRNGFVPNSQEYCTCADCHSSHKLSKSTVVNYSPDGRLYIVHNFCDGICALNNGYQKCACCSKWLKINDENNHEYLYLESEGYVCSGCISRHYAECEDCSRTYLSRRMHRNNDGTHHCSYCLDNGRRLIHEHSYRPNFSFQKMAWENTRYLGIELEIEVNGDKAARERMADKIKVWLSQQPPTADVKTREGKIIKGKSLDKLVFIKSDGSLKNGLEIVFHPFTLKSFHKNFPLQPFLKFLAENNGVVKENCGMHIHVSKERLSSIDLLKGKWLFHKCEPFLKKFSERAKYEYCKFDRYPPNQDPYYQEYGHYSVLNIAGPTSKTLEVRIFNATLDYHKFLANMQFSDVFVDYIQHGGGLAFLKTASPHVIWQNFIDYAKNQNRYQIFTRWILTKAIV